MTQPTQLDDPVSEGEPPSKVARVAMAKEVMSTGRDKIKWLLTEDSLIPYVLKESTQVVHCGRSEMKLNRMQCSHGPSVVVECIKGCDPQCIQGMGAQCTCFCHVLKAHYIAREAVVPTD